MLFSCLVDADYTVSALSTYLDRPESRSFDPQLLLKKLTEYRDGIRQSSAADRSLNTYRDRVFEQYGKMGDEPEGLYTLTALPSAVSAAIWNWPTVAGPGWALFWGVSRNRNPARSQSRYGVAPHAGASRNSVDGKEERRAVLPPSYKKFSPEGLC